MKTYWTCAVYDGSTSSCGFLEHTCRECGHKHRSEEKAYECLQKLRREDNRAWFAANVVERAYKDNTDIISVLEDGPRGPDSKRVYKSAYDACKC